MVSLNLAAVCCVLSGKQGNMKITLRKKESTDKLNKTFFSVPLGKGRSDNKVIYIHQNKINEVILLSGLLLCCSQV